MKAKLLFMIISVSTPSAWIVFVAWPIYQTTVFAVFVLERYSKQNIVTRGKILLLGFSA